MSSVASVVTHFVAPFFKKKIDLLCWQIGYYFYVSVLGYFQRLMVASYSRWPHIVKIPIRRFFLSHAVGSSFAPRWCGKCAKILTSRLRVVTSLKNLLNTYSNRKIPARARLNRLRKLTKDLKWCSFHSGEENFAENQGGILFNSKLDYHRVNWREIDDQIVMLQSNFCLNIRRKIRSLCLTAIS